MTFEELVAAHGPALWRAVASYAPPGAERDDLAQDVFLALWKALPSFRRDSSARTFALRVAHNRGLSHVWRRARRPEAGGALPDLPDPRPGADELLASSERAERLLRHLRTLPLGQRQVLGLALEGLSHAEIGEIVGITPENVAVRLGRAREALRRSLEQEEAA
jgi:RNA polymerase sigma-70 factor (ECF subfamily)